jgi:hypothetical protein
MQTPAGLYELILTPQTGLSSPLQLIPCSFVASILLVSFENSAKSQVIQLRRSLRRCRGVFVNLLHVISLLMKAGSSPPTWSGFEDDGKGLECPLVTAGTPVLGIPEIDGTALK